MKSMSLKISMSKRKPVFGVGINDADYIVGKCPFYRKWTNMLMRCYSETYLINNPSYRGCTVSDSWLVFSNFRSWLENKGYGNNTEYELDKDILVKGNREYSENVCCLVPKEVNSFLVKLEGGGKFLPGVYYCKQDKVFVSQIRDNGKKLRIGSFDNELGAHDAWWERKCKLSESISELILDLSVRIKFKEIFVLYGDK